MKFLLSLLAVSAIATSASARHGHGHGHGNDGDIALLATTTAAFLVTLSHADSHAYHSLMVEAAPLAGEYLSTGKGLENQALVAAMIVVQNGDKSIANDELALRVIEEANK